MRSAGQIHASYEMYTLSTTYMIKYGPWKNEISLPKYICPNKIFNIACLFISAIMKVFLIPTAKWAVTWSLGVSIMAKINASMSNTVHLMHIKNSHSHSPPPLLFFSPSVFAFLRFSAY